MVLLLDAGGLYAQANRSEPLHERVIAAIDDESGALVTSEAAAQEADYLIGARLGVDAELAFLEDLATGAFQVECLSPVERRTAHEVARRYRDLRLGLADTSLIVLAKRFGTVRLLTVDERHFRAVSPLQGGHFTILPADTP
ncbi:MAG: type II toxin-antitoxin system VapC family toxin [Egibacteraceae bacterium]